MTNASTPTTPSASPSTTFTPNFFANNPFLKSFVCGGLAGASTGLVVAPFEHLKVFIQSANPAIDWQSKQTYTQRLPKTVPHMLKTMPYFSVNFGIICALEFSINAHLDKKYGMIAGCTASALTAGSLLTLADHLMMYSNHKISPLNALKKLVALSPTAPLTGLTPMVFREALFIMSVAHTGPIIGKMLQEKVSNQPANSADELESKWKFWGRFLSGLMTTLISHPSDTLARKLQLELYHTYMVNTNHAPRFTQPKLTTILRNTGSINQLFLGLAPRMALATFGCALIGNSYDYFDKKLSDGAVKHVHETSVQPVDARQIATPVGENITQGTLSKSIAYSMWNKPANDTAVQPEQEQGNTSTMSKK